MSRVIEINEKFGSRWNFVRKCDEFTMEYFFFFLLWWNIILRTVKAAVTVSIENTSMYFRVSWNCVWNVWEKMGTLRIDFKISIDILDYDTLCSTYNLEIFDKIEIFLACANFLPKQRMRITCIYFRVRIKFQSFHYLSWKVFNLGISKI